MDNISEIDTATDERSIFKTAFFQYDRGLKVRLLNVPVDRDYRLNLEMCNSGDSEIKHIAPYTGDDIEIEQDLLTDGRNVQLYLFAVGDNWGKTVLDVMLRINRRPSM